MKIALIDAALRPLPKAKRGGGLPAGFRPSVDIMKVFAYCRRERMDVRILTFREEMEDLSGYSVVVVAKGCMQSKTQPAVRMVMEGLGWPKSRFKSVFDSLYDMHEGTDLCVVGQEMRERGGVSKLGPAIDECPADIDAYGEALYLRFALDSVMGYCKKRPIDLGYGRVMTEDGGWMSLKAMTMYSGSSYIELCDPDPASIPCDVMDSFAAASRGFRLLFRYPLDLARADDMLVNSICLAKWFGRMEVSGNLVRDRAKVLRLADAVGSRNIQVTCGSIGIGAYKKEDCFSAILEAMRSKYDSETLGISMKMRLSDDAKDGAYHDLYSAVLSWMSAPAMFYGHTLDWYIRWQAQAMADKGKASASKRLLDAYAEFRESSGLAADMADNMTGTRVIRHEYMIKE